jgi:hypothetical protein
VHTEQSRNVADCLGFLGPEMFFILPDPTPCYRFR